MTIDALLLVLLVVQGVMGGFDTLVNHDLIEHLAKRPSARTEVGLHAMREAIYAALFAGLGWFAWHGAMAALIAGLLVAELLVSATDEYVENLTRVLPQNERVLHLFLTLNLGFLIVVAGLVLPAWLVEPAGLALRSAGPLTWVLSALAALSLFWAARDFSAWRRLRGNAPSTS